VAIGLTAGLLGALTMNLFARVVRRRNGGREAEGAAPGINRDGRGAQPPQAIARADDDAAVRVGRTAYRTVTGVEPSLAIKPWLGSAAHYAFGGSLGIYYVLAADRAPLLRAGYGTLFGSLVWAIADEGVMPALGLSRGPRQLSSAVHAYAVAAHWVYGATLEAIRQCALRTFSSLWRSK
jgi:uncharacterized membrane protein YagU involved in acid resistance